MNNRDIKLSNLKGLLVFLVVFGHVIEHYNKQLNELYVSIYTFHMPLFIFISGYLAKRIKLDKIINLFLLYLIFQTFYNWFLYILGDSDTFSLSYAKPQFHLWYIVSLGVWYTLALLISSLKLKSLGKIITFVVILTVSFISRWFVKDIELAIKQYYSNFTTYTLSYQRTLSFAPFFFLGFFITNPSLIKLYSFIQSNKYRLVVSLSLLMCLFLLIQKYPDIEDIFRGSYGAYKFLKPTDGFAEYLIKVLFGYMVSFLMCILVLNSVNDNKSVLTKWGDNSLTIFLFHPVFVFYLWKFRFFEVWKWDSQILFFFLLTIWISSVLGSNIFVKYTMYICNPYYSLIRLLTPLRKLIYNKTKS